VALQKDREFHAGLRGTVAALLQGNVTPADLNRFIRLCLAMAESHLANRRLAAVLSRFHALNLSDLAFDCIADLFARDTTGRFPQLIAYFQSCHSPRLSDEELVVFLRRLISSKVNQGVFRLLGEIDPSLSKILRNIKLAIAALRNFDEVDWFGEPCIIPSLCDPLESLPAPEQNDLERALIAVTHGNEHIPELLGKLAMYLRTQTTHRRRIGLVATALLFRSVFTARAELPEETTDQEDVAQSLDRAAAVRLAMDDLRNKALRYVERGKMDQRLYESYCRVIEEGLLKSIVDKNGEGFTLFESLQSVYPTLTKEQYRKVHRSRLEYLARMADQMVARHLKQT
jgi:hypothetical protein